MSACSRCGRDKGCKDYFIYSGIVVCLCASCDKLAIERFGYVNWLENLGWFRYGSVARPNPFSVALEAFLAEGKLVY